MPESEQISKPLNIYQRLNAIKKDVAYIKKDKEVTGAGSYMAVTHDAVTAATRAKFVEHGVLVMPFELSSAVVDSGMVTGKGNPIIRFEARYRVSFMNIDEPADSASIELAAHALDQGDKAPGKALSYATKYAVLKVLQMETGDEEESREAAKPKKHDDIPVPAGPIYPNSGAMDNIPKERHEYIHRIVASVVDCFNADQPQEAYKAYLEVEDNEERMGVWSWLDSSMRKRLKAMEPKKAVSPRQESQHGLRP